MDECVRLAPVAIEERELALIMVYAVAVLVQRYLFPMYMYTRTALPAVIDSRASGTGQLLQQQKKFHDQLRIGRARLLSLGS